MHTLFFLVNDMLPLIRVNFLWILRDRFFQAILAVALLLIAMVPVISYFSMRQTQELAVTLALSFISAVLLVCSLLLGCTMVWRDLERRYSYALLSLPQARSGYLLAKFFAVAGFLLLCALCLAAAAALAVKLSILEYPSEIPVQWGRFFVAILADVLKYSLLAALAMLLTTFATSFFLPFFVTLAIFLTGSASQEVYEFVTSRYAREFSDVGRVVFKSVYYIIPNFSAFDLKLQAIYPIAFDTTHVLFLIGYHAVYLTMVLCLAIWVFSRRELV